MKHLFWAIALSLGICVYSQDPAPAPASGTDCSLDGCSAACYNPPVECDACLDNHVSNADSSKCLECPDHCAESGCKATGASTECSQCEAGFYPASGGKACQHCPSGCDECEANGAGAKCPMCREGFRNTAASTCKPCGGNCMRCQDDVTCLQCNVNFFLSSGSCFSCPGASKCASCASADVCDTCIVGTYWNAEAKDCSSCGTNCATCDSGDTCLTCISGFVLSTDNQCYIETAYCVAGQWEDGVGCTECQPGYTLDAGSCHKCHALNNQNDCEMCMTDTRARFWDGSQCKYCPENCLDCDDDTSCNSCVTGKIWITDSCVDCGDGLNEVQCNLCPNRYWDAASASCISCDGLTMDQKDTATKCSRCPHSDTQSNLFGTGHCKELDCAAADLTEDECNSCHAKIWDAGTAACVDFTCPDDLLTVDSGMKCDKCDSPDALHYWTPATCETMTNGCVGDVSNEHICSCQPATPDDQRRYWEADTCRVTSCTAAEMLKSQEQCEACPGKYWNTGTCVVIDCDTGVLDDEAKCKACKHAFKYWDGTACTLFLEADCNDKTSAPDSANLCMACTASYPPILWNWIVDPTGTNTGCYSMDGSMCDGSSDDVASDDLSSEMMGPLLCTLCPDMVWAEGACMGLNCHKAALTEAECGLCDAKVWNTGTSACDDINCQTDALDTEAKCRACSGTGKYWDAATSSCAVMSDCTNGVKDTVEKCAACPNTRWQLGVCAALDCTDETSLTTEYSCNECHEYYWSATTSSCKTVNCNKAVDTFTEVECGRCSDSDNKPLHYWDPALESGKCRLGVDCASDSTIIYDSARCMYCSDVTDQAVIWESAQPVCHACPENCKSCDQDECLSCVSGMVWDGASCVQCATAVLDTQAKCETCPGKFWSAAKMECAACMEGCLECTSAKSCSLCETGKVYDSTTGKEACISCIFNENECAQCGSVLTGNYYDTDLCHVCPMGCSSCESSTTCTSCAANYFMDDDNLCKSCSTPVDTKEKCAQCAKYWDGTACQACTDLDAKCTTCVNGDTCESCQGGYYLDATVCKACSASCLSCSGAGDCAMCTSGMMWDSATTKCVACPSQCSQCTTDGCSKCKSGYRLSAGQCEPCGPTNCDTCSDAETCDSCKSGFCLDKDKEMCYPTSLTCALCEMVDTQVQCVTCQDRTYHQVCERCTNPWCEECSDNKNTCTRCMAGSYLEAGTCKECVSSGLCLECSQADECVKCVDGYYIADDFTCKKCGSNCAVCSSGDSCETCTGSNFYKLEDGTGGCKKCMTDCVECTSEATCRTCAPGFFVQEGACAVCASDENCATCENADTCQECKMGYFLTNGACASCSDSIENCIHCADSNMNGAPECHACGAGYTLKDHRISENADSCIAWSISNCESPVDPAPICNQCDSGLVASDDKQLCGKPCYECEGESCKNTPSQNSSSTVVCPGLGNTHSCVVKQVTLTEDNTVTYSRGCQEVKCTELTELCQDKEGIEECSICCNDGLCNTQVLTGETYSYAVQARAMLGLLVSMAIAAVLIK